MQKKLANESPWKNQYASQSAARALFNCHAALRGMLARIFSIWKP